MRFRNPFRQLRTNMQMLLTISDCTERRILHEDLQFQPYKLAVVQTLYPLDLVSQKSAYEALIENWHHDCLVFFSNEGPCDYFLLGYLKSLVYTKRPKALGAL